MLVKMKKAQSTLEYALLIGVVVGAFLAMQNYLKRSLQGRMQIIGDQMGDQYSPGLTMREENMLVNNARIVETITRGRGGQDLTAGGPSTTTDITGGYQSMNSYREVRPLDEETWSTSSKGTE